MSNDPTSMSTEPVPLPKVPGEGVQRFEDVRKPGVVYVDKTRFIQRMVSEEQPAFFCAKPRRFGKTLMISTLEAFFKGKKELFRGLDIEEYMESPAFVECPVIRLDMNAIPSDEGISGFRDNLVFEISRIASCYGVSVQKKSPVLAFKDLVFNVYKLHGSVALLIDEYDSQLVNTFDNKELNEEMRKALKSFYNIVKSYDSSGYIKFIFITGISKFSRVGIFSAMNNLTDVSFGKGYGEMHGYTETEIHKYFDGYISATAKDLSMTPESLMKDLHDYYDGYFFGDNDNVYNPVSINNFFIEKEFKKFWIRTGSQEFIERYISAKKINVEALDGIEINADQIEEPGEISRELAPEFFLYQGGYLTVQVVAKDKKGKNALPAKGRSQSVRTKYRLVYPNHEVRSAMYKLVMKNYFKSQKMMYERIDKFFDLLDRGQYAKAILLTNEILAILPHQDTGLAMSKKEGERYYRAPLLGFLCASDMFIIPECPSVLGQSDIVFDYNMHTYVIELKTAMGEKNAKAELVRAMDQIFGKKYAERFPDPVRIGIVVDEKERSITHICMETKVYHVQNKKLHAMGTLQKLKETLAAAHVTEQRPTENVG